MTDVTERYRAFYDGKVDEYLTSDPMAVSRCEKAIELAGLDTSMRVLDIACKDAVLLKTMQSVGVVPKYVGVDIAQRLIDRNTAEGLPGTFVCADITAGGGFPDKSFDRIFALEILEHVPTPDKLLREAHRLLADDGVLILSVPNPYYYMEILNEVRRRPDSDGHLFSFTNANIGALFAHCDFEIESSTGTHLLVPKTLRSPFRDQKVWVLKRVPEILACSRVYRVRKKR
jgi:SAM-dependent methyltransferase